jgi:4'-phosphopantetheinyl transferase
MPGPVDVWLIPAGLPDTVLTGFTGLLDDDERRRLAGMANPGERRLFLAAHGAARTILGGITGVPAHRLRWEAGVNGKPRLAEPAGLHANLSHSGELCLFAVAGAGREVGVDVQHLPSGLDPVAMAARRYPTEEAAFVAAAADHAGRLNRFVTLWARKEACVKAAGGKLAEGMKLQVGGDSPVRASRPGGPLPGPFLVTDIAVPSGYRAAIALNGDDPYDVVCRWWPFAAEGTGA